MSSPLNRQHRRTAPYVIMNNHTRPPSVAYSARQSDQEQSNNTENNIQTLPNSSLEDEIHVTTTSLFNLVRRAQVCLIYINSFFRKKKFIFSDCTKFSRCK
jgi:hypothetical protein